MGGGGRGVIVGWGAVGGSGGVGLEMRELGEGELLIV